MRRPGTRPGSSVFSYCYLTFVFCCSLSHRACHYCIFRTLSGFIMFCVRALQAISDIVGSGSSKRNDEAV